MTIEITRTIGTGGNHPHLKDFGSWLLGQDLVAQDAIVRAHVISNLPADANNTNVQLHPATYDVAHYCILEPAPGQGWADLNPTGPLFYPSSGIELQIPLESGLELGHGMVMQGFRIKVPEEWYGYSAGRICLGMRNNGGAGNCPPVFQRNIVESQLGISMTGASPPNQLVKFLFTGNNATTAHVRDNIFIQSKNPGVLVQHAWDGEVARNTFVRTGTAAGTGALIMAGIESDAFCQDNVFIDCGDAPIDWWINPDYMADRAYPNYTHIALKPGMEQKHINTYAVALGDGNNLVQNKASDLRPKAGGPLIGAASGRAVSIDDVRKKNRGTAPDVGAIQLVAAVVLPTLTVQSTNLDGQTVIISGTTTGNPVSGTARIEAASTDPNGALSQGPIALTLGNGTFTVTFSNVAPGNYAPPVLTVTNAGGTTTSYASAFTIAGIGGQPIDDDTPAAGVTTATMSGATLTVSGTANLAGDVAGTVQGFLDPQPSGTPVGPVNLTVSNGAWSHTANDVAAGKWKFRVVVNANGKTASASSAEVRVVSMTGALALPVPA